MTRFAMWKIKRTASGRPLILYWVDCQLHALGRGLLFLFETCSGTLAPSLRALESPIATACYRLLTLVPDLLPRLLLMNGLLDFLGLVLCSWALKLLPSNCETGDQGRMGMSHLSPVPVLKRMAVPTVIASLPYVNFIPQFVDGWLLSKPASSLYQWALVKRRQAAMIQRLATTSSRPTHTRHSSRRAPARSRAHVLDVLHGYVSPRWPYLYIGIGTGEHPLAKSSLSPAGSTA